MGVDNVIHVLDSIPLPKADRFPRSLAIPVLQAKPIDLFKAIQSSGMILKALQRVVLNIKGGWLSFLNFEHCMIGLAFALASRPVVRSSQGGANLDLYCHVLSCD